LSTESQIHVITGKNVIDWIYNVHKYIYTLSLCELKLIKWLSAVAKLNYLEGLASSLSRVTIFSRLMYLLWSDILKLPAKTCELDGSCWESRPVDNYEGHILYYTQTSNCNLTGGLGNSSPPKNSPL